MEEQYKYTVCIHCMTYNHEKYLADALDGFVMQKTNFPFVAVVIDDFSNDGTADILRKYEAKYPDIIKAVYLQENYYSQHKPKKPFLEPYDSQSKYIALCEGDDYWTDPLKLQKQVDYLENHPDYSMCFHAAKIQCEDNNIVHSLHSIECEVVENREYESTELFEHWIVPTASIIYHSTLNLKTIHADWLVAGDINLVLRCAHIGKVFGMKDIMSVYRVQPYGLTQSTKNKENIVMRHPKHYKCLYINYPKINVKSISWVIAASYYTRMRYRKDILGKIGDLICVFYWNPHIIIFKIKNWFNM